MSSPSRPIPYPQARAFDLAVCKRLGIDPSIVSATDFNAGFTVTGGDEFGEVRVSLTARLPAEEILAMFNGAVNP